MHADQIEHFVTALDTLLVVQGFKRRSRSHEWRKKLDQNNEAWVHVNFGIDLVNPSLGVAYLDLARTLPATEIGTKLGTMQMLHVLAKPADAYSLEIGPHAVLTDLREAGLAAFDRLRDRQAVADMLKSSVVSDWPVPSSSDRIRLLPVLLASLGRIDEALEIANGFAAEASARDQTQPKYEVFHAAFTARFAPSKQVNAPRHYR